MRYPYQECGEGESQYADVTPAGHGGDIVQAVYVHAPLKEDEGNPYIEALPYPLEQKGVVSFYTTVIPDYSRSRVEKMSGFERKMQIEKLKSVRLPLPFHAELEFTFYSVLTASYRARYRLHAGKKGVPCVAQDEEAALCSVLTGDSADATGSGFSVIGRSGCGKTSALGKLLSRYPQVIRHEDEDGWFIQIVYLVVNCVSNSNFHALYAGIGEAIDKALGNTTEVYEKEIRKMRTLGQKADKVRELVEKFGVGIVLFDEIQLIDFAHTRENSFDSLLTLTNRTKVALGVVGTEDARDKMFSELRTARRTGLTINAGMYCTDKRYFRLLLHTIANYQWTDKPFSVTDEIADAFYERTGGIVSLLIDLYAAVQRKTVEKGDGTSVDGDFIRKTADQCYGGMQDAIAVISKENAAAAGAEEKDKAELIAESYLDLEAQKKEAEKILESAAEREQERITLENVTASIQMVHECRASDIEEAFKTVTGKKSNAGKSERAVTQLVWKELERMEKRKRRNPGVKTVSIAQMRSFLNEDAGEESRGA